MFLFRRKYKHETPFVGVYRGRTPQLLIIDSNMVKDVLIKDFKNFEDSESTSVVSLQFSFQLSQSKILFQIGWQETGSVAG